MWLALRLLGCKWSHSLLVSAQQMVPWWKWYYYLDPVRLHLLLAECNKYQRMQAFYSSAQAYHI